MMIGPENFYEMNLKNKNEKEINSVIRGLKNKIGHLKNEIENPNYEEEFIIHPDKLTQIKCNRLYLKRAKKALKDIGAVYKPSKKEIFEDDFQKRISDIKEIKIESMGYLSNKECIAYFEDDKVHIKKESLLHNSDDKDNDFIHELNKEEFLEEFSKLYIGEWKKKYSILQYGNVYIEGIKWTLLITYNDGKTYSIKGDNSYPYNFNELTDLLCIENFED